jgi:hypothetical protein
MDIKVIGYEDLHKIRPAPEKGQSLMNNLNESSSYIEVFFFEELRSSICYLFYCRLT